MNVRKPHTLILALGGLLCLLAVAGWGQDKSTGGIRGRVMDVQGNALADVEIRLISKGPAQGRKTTSSDTGAYRFVRLPPGVYGLEATKAGFVTGKVEEVKVAVNEFAQVPLYLRKEGT
jgi:carboxypeptidase family protein